MVRLVLTELFKVRKRWMPWILLGIMVAILALFQFGMYAGHRSLESTIEPEPTPEELPSFIPESQQESIREELREHRQQERQDMLDQLGALVTLPRATEGIFSMAGSVGGFLLVILAASIVGGEYAWGTVRTNLILGMGRRRYLLSKVIAVLLLTLAGLVVTFVFGFVFAIGTTLLMNQGVDWSFLGGLFVPRVLAMFGRTWFILAAPISMAVMVAVLTRSSAVAIGVGIAYPIVESIVAGVLANIAGWGETFQQYTIGYNMTSVMALNAMGERYASAGINLGNAPGGTVPAFWRTASLLLGYGLAFLAVAFYSFRKRDLTA